MRSFWQNLEIKAMAVISALLLWLFVVGVENDVTTFPQDLSVSAENLPSNLSLSGLDETVRLRVKTTEVEVQSLTANDFEVVVDLEGLSEGAYEMNVEARSSNPLVSVVEVMPAVVDFELEAIESQMKPIELNVEGEVAAGFQLSRVFVEPEEVAISGNRSLLEQIGGIAPTIEMDGSENRDFSRVVILKADDLIGVEVSENEVRFDPERVEVRFLIDETEPMEEGGGEGVLGEGEGEGELLEGVVDEGVGEVVDGGGSVLRRAMVDVGLAAGAEAREIVPGNVVVTLEDSAAGVDLENVVLEIDPQDVVGGIYEVRAEDLVGIEVEDVSEISPAEIRVVF